METSKMCRLVVPVDNADYTEKMWVEKFIRNITIYLQNHE
jgi:hypothetical protein